jgi:hypothetical protein
LNLPAAINALMPSGNAATFMTLECPQVNLPTYFLPSVI